MKAAWNMHTLPVVNKGQALDVSALAKYRDHACFILSRSERKKLAKIETM